MLPAGSILEFPTGNYNLQEPTKNKQDIAGKVPIHGVLQAEQGSHKGCPYHSGRRTTWNLRLPLPAGTVQL